MIEAGEALSLPVEDIFFQCFKAYVEHWKLVYEPKKGKHAGHALVLWDATQDGFRFFQSRIKALESGLVSNRYELSRWLQSSQDKRARYWNELSAPEKNTVLNPPKVGGLIGTSKQGTAIWVEQPFGSGSYVFFSSITHAYRVTGIDRRTLEAAAKDPLDKRAYWANEDNPKKYWES